MNALRADWLAMGLVAAAAVFFAAMVLAADLVRRRPITSAWRVPRRNPDRERAEHEARHA